MKIGTIDLHEILKLDLSQKRGKLELVVSAVFKWFQQ
jgi:hypothetical protein